MFNIPSVNKISKWMTYLDLAGATHKGWSSGITPLPMGVGKNGSLQPSTKSLTAFSAPAYAAPVNICCEFVLFVEY